MRHKVLDEVDVVDLYLRKPTVQDGRPSAGKVLDEIDVVDLYLRKSTVDDGRSVAGQNEELTAGAVGQGLAIGRVFVDPDLSASRFARKGRPDYEELIAYISEGSCRVLGLWEASRGSRDLGEWVALLDLCRARGTRIWVFTHRRVYDLSLRRDWRTLAEEGIDAADESEKIAERTRRGKRMAAAEGRPAGKLVYGFVRAYDERGRFVQQVEHPKQAPILREMVDGLYDGQSLNEVARRLAARGVLTGNGVAWTAGQIRRTVLNPSYIGKRVHRGVVVGDALWEPIVDPLKWHDVRSVLVAPGRRLNKDSKLAHWLTNAVQCGGCRKGQLKAASRAGGQRLVYMCRSCFKVAMSARGLEGLVEDAILDRLRGDDAKRLFAPRTSDTAIKRAMNEEATLRARLVAHYVESAAGKLSAPGLGAVESLLQPQIDAAALKVRKLTLPPDLAALADVDVVAEWDDLEPRLRRVVARGLADLVLMPSTAKTGSKIDPTRLDQSRWVGDTKTWGELRRKTHRRGSRP